MTVDLGLKAILDGEGEGTQGESSGPAMPPTVQEDIPPSALQTLRDAGQWRDLAVASERLLAEDHTNIEAKLYWLISQAESGALPRSFLVAPLDEAKQALRDSDQSTPSLEGLALEAENAIKARTITEEGSDQALVSPPEFRASPVLGNSLAGLGGEEKAKQSRRWKVAALVSAIAATFGVSGIYFTSSGSSSTGSTIAPVAVLFPQADPALISSEVQTSAGFGRLTALVYDIDALKATPAVAQAETAGAKAPAAIEPAPTPPAAAAVAVSQPRKERVRTDGPIEPDQVRNRILGDRAPISGPLPEVSRSRDEGSAYRPSASVEPGGVYQVGASTSVLSEPSAYGRVLGTLRPGDRVKVDATFGRWARLVGNRGRSGFVEIQDISDRRSDR